VLDLSGNNAILKAGSITGTITVDNNALIGGSPGSTIVGPAGTGPWAEIITSATINITSSNKIVSSAGPGIEGLAIDSGAMLTLIGGTHAENIFFANNFLDSQLNHINSGKLVIGSTALFTGTIYGLVDGDQIDLANLTNTANAHIVSSSFALGTTTLTVTDGTHTDALKLSGDYTSSTWTFSADGSGGTILVDPPSLALTPGVDTVSFINGINQIIGTSATVTNGDLLTGGAGSDTLTIDTANGANHTFVFGDGAGDHSDIGLTNFENLVLTAAANNEDTITLKFNSDFQNNGTLTVDGSAQHDLNGTNLTVDAHLASHDSFVLIGTKNADTLIGGSHDDIIMGGGGDKLTGGGGNDTFVFKALSDSQAGAGHFATITDFTPGADHIDLTAVTNGTTVQGAITNGTLNANSIAWTVDVPNNQTIIYVNTGTTAVSTANADMEIHLTGSNINLSGSDILHHT
jgi:hypothetical protein